MPILSVNNVVMNNIRSGWCRDVCQSKGCMCRMGIVLGLKNVNLDQRYVGHT